MTTPNQTTAPDGAFTIGGGTWNYGQNVTQDMVKAMFELPTPTAANILDIIQMALERLPLDALKAFQPILGAADALFADVSTAVSTILSSFVTKPPLAVLSDIVDAITGSVGGGITELEAWAAGLGTGLSTLMIQFQTFLGTITSLSTWLDVWKQVTDFFVTISSRTTWLAVFKEVVDFFNTITSRTAWLAVFKTTVDTFKTLFDSIGTGVWAAVSGVVTTFSALLTSLGTDVWTVLNEIITYFTGVFSGAGTVGSWLTGVLTTLSKLPAWNLIGQIPAATQGVVNIGHLTTTPVNLLLHPGFEDSSTVSPVDGWSWDGSTNATGSGGSAKVTLDGYNKELSHQTSVLVTPGDKMTISAAVKTSGVTGTGWKACVTVMEYRDGAIATPVEIVNRNSAATSWVTIAGDYTVPTGVTSVVFRLTVESATGGTVWFDDLNLHKTGILEQTWVTNLPNTWENFWAGLVGTSGTGKIWSDMGTAGSSVRAVGTGAQGSADTANGNNQLLWNGLYDASSGTTGSTGKTVTNVATAVTNHRAISVGAQSLASTADGNATAAGNNVQLTWNNLFDAHSGTTGSTGKTVSNVYTAASGHRGISTGAASAASTADGKAVTAGNNIQDTWNKIFDAFNGTSGSTGQTAATAQAVAAANQTKTDGTVDGFVNGYRGQSITGWLTSDAQAAAASIKTAAANLSTVVAGLQAAAGAGSFSGNSVSVTFTGTSATLGSAFTLTHSGTGDLTYQLVSGKAQWVGTTATQRKVVGVYNATQTLTDYQKVSMVLGSDIGGGTANPSYNYLYGRMNAAGTQYVYAKVGGGQAVVGYNSGAGETPFTGGTASATYYPGATVTLTCGLSTSAQKTFALAIDGSYIFGSLVDSGAASVQGASNRYTGIGSVAATYPGVSPGALSTRQSIGASLGGFAFYDNVPPTYKGSAFRASNLTATAMSVTATSALMPNSWYAATGANTWSTTDYTYTPGTNNKLQVAKEGWYYFNIVQGCTNASVSGGGRSRLTIWKNGSVHSYGPETNYVNATGSVGASYSGMIYLLANEYIQPGYQSSWAHSLWTADTSGLQTYFQVNFVGNTFPT